MKSLVFHVFPPRSPWTSKKSLLVAQRRPKIELILSRAVIVAATLLRNSFELPYVRIAAKGQLSIIRKREQLITWFGDPNRNYDKSRPARTHPSAPSDPPEYLMGPVIFRPTKLTAPPRIDPCIFHRCEYHKRFSDDPMKVSIATRYERWLKIKVENRGHKRVNGMEWHRSQSYMEILPPKDSASLHVYFISSADVYGMLSAPERV